jgi:Uma2 family endonuclease
MSMTTVEEIKRAIERLNLDDWFDVQDCTNKLIESRTLTTGVKEPQAAYEPNPPWMTFEEYLEFVDHSPLRYEYVNGVVRAMSPASVTHARLGARLFTTVEAHLRGGPCEAFPPGAGLQIRSDTDEINYIPDFMVACNPEICDDRWICNPKLVVEVISPSTRHIDECEKATNYRRVRSIEEILLVEQLRPKITVFRRTAKWRPQTYAGTDSVLELRSIGLSVPLAQIYAPALSAG